MWKKIKSILLMEDWKSHFFVSTLFGLLVFFLMYKFLISGASSSQADLYYVSFTKKMFLWLIPFWIVVCGWLSWSDKKRKERWAYEEENCLDCGHDRKIHELMVKDQKRCGFIRKKTTTTIDDNTIRVDIEVCCCKIFRTK